MPMTPPEFGKFIHSAGRVLLFSARPLAGAVSAARRNRRLLPAVLKSIRRKFGVTHRVLNVLVPQPSLQCPRVVAGVGQGIAAAVPQHVRMDRKRHFCASPDPTE